jgi:integrase
MSTAKSKNYGGLIQRGDTWHMRFTIKGVMVAESTHTTVRRDAERILATRKSELVEQVVLKKVRPIKFYDAIDEYSNARKHLPSYENIKTQMAIFKRLPNVTLDKITDHQLQTIIEDRYAAGLKASTVGVTVTFLNSLLNYCANKGYSVRRKLPRIKGIKGRIRFLSPAEEVAWFAAIKQATPYKGRHYTTTLQKQDNWDLCLCLRHTGARYSEIGDMNWNQVDFAKKTVTVKRGKGSNDSTIPMTDALFEVLSRRRKLVDEKGKLFEHVFPTKKGRHHETAWVRASVKRAGLSDLNGRVSLHTLRHTAAVHWLSSGMNILEVQYMLGHKSITSTMVYLHLLPTDTGRKAADIINASTTLLQNAAKSPV